MTTEQFDFAAIMPDMNFWQAQFDMMEMAEEEIQKAQARHRERGHGPIWRSFILLRPTSDRLETDLLYRSHCRELLERVAASKDTRPATQAEMIAALSAASTVAPMTSAATCLYMRLFTRTFPEHASSVLTNLDLEAYESVHGSTADDHEAFLRGKLRQDWRVPKAPPEEEANAA